MQILRTNNYYKSLLGARLAELQLQEATNAESRDTVVLDQTSVGRLSRMDAIQQQAMANATRQIRTTEVQAIKSALLRLAEDEYGYCEGCGEEIPAKRLELIPTAIRCVGCAKG